MPQMIIAHGESHPGPRRHLNEDCFLCDLDHGLFVVADGMGGHQAGEVASQLAVDTVRLFIARTRDDEKVTWPYGVDPGLSFDANRLMSAIKIANRRVFKASENSEQYLGMGTTIVAVLVTEGHLVLSSVGDSRVYALGPGGLTQLTQDDSWVSLLLANQTLDADAVARHPMRHVLTNVVGAREQIECRVHERTWSGSETLLLSTDGLHGTLEPDAMATVLRANPRPADAAAALIQEALRRGSADNVTALVISCRS